MLYRLAFLRTCFQGASQGCLIEKVYQINKLFYFAAPCETKPYRKSDGKYFCGFTVKANLNWKQADDACKTKGGRLPEIYSISDNSDINKQRVS